jgi:hypothetical protein
VLSRLLPFLVRWLARTLRVRVAGPLPDPSRPHVYAFLHGRQLGLLRYPRPGSVVVLSSLSRDGSLQARVLGSLGFDVARGSTTRGGDAGLLSVVRAVRRGASAALAVDGPRGPSGEVKPGALFVAQAAGALVVPVTTSAASSLRLSGTWDGFTVPLPWSRVLITRGEAFAVPTGAGRGAVEEGRARLEQTLRELTATADASMRAGHRQDLR